jgi:uncharacterized membrane protein HdeD (DUF308 family)
MVKLALLLIGPGAFRRQWSVLAVIGGALVVLSLLLALDVSATVTDLTYAALGLVFVGNGLIGGLMALCSPVGVDRRLGLAKAIVSAVVGGLILAAPFQSDGALAVLFAVALILDGAVRMASALIYRYSGWWVIALFGLGEASMALMILAEWPLPADRNAALCVGLFLGLSGWLLLRLGFLLRTLEDEAAILLLPVFSNRGWYDNAPVLIGEAPPQEHEHPIIVRVWTPAGSIGAPERRPLIDRYLAAVDQNGVISTGHSALERTPDLYISHYPAVEVEHSEQSFLTTLSSKPENDVAGRFIGSYTEEVASWCEADACVTFRTYSERRLRVFWAGYRQDNRYNLTNRNCSVLVATALDAALEGVLADPSPWLRLARLLLNPDLWVASMLRSRASSMTWTPGLLLDYARAVANIVERSEQSWTTRLRAALARRRRENPNMDIVAS